MKNLNDDLFLEQMKKTEWYDALNTCSISKEFRKMCDEKFWYNWWLSRNKSIDERTALVNKIFMISKGKINEPFFKGALRAGINIDGVLNSAIEGNHYEVVDVLMSLGAKGVDTWTLNKTTEKTMDFKIIKIILPYLSKEKFTEFIQYSTSVWENFENVTDSKRYVSNIIHNIIKYYKYDKVVVNKIIHDYLKKIY